jgi:hypothetical protein
LVRRHVTQSAILHKQGFAALLLLIQHGSGCGDFSCTGIWLIGTRFLR